MRSRTPPSPAISSPPASADVTVRVILDQNLEKSGNTSAFTQLNAQPHCSAVWANKAFQATHEKSFIIDGTQTAIMSLNLQPQYYSTTRDFAMIENDPADVAAIAATFSADFAAGTTASGTSGTSDFNYTPGSGSHLIWSPTTAQTAMVNLIAFAKKTLLIENEELASSATAILTALETACKNGVQVQVAMVNNTSYATSFAAITKAGCSVHTYPDQHDRLLHPRQGRRRRLRPPYTKRLHGLHQLLQRVDELQPRARHVRHRRSHHHLPPRHHAR